MSIIYSKHSGISRRNTVVILEVKDTADKICAEKEYISNIYCVENEDWLLKNQLL